MGCADRLVCALREVQWRLFKTRQITPGGAVSEDNGWRRVAEAAHKLRDAFDEFWAECDVGEVADAFANVSFEIVCD